MKFNWLWQAVFINKNLQDDNFVIITQPEDDRYSKHDDNAKWNPSSYRDFLDYFKDHRDELYQFRLFNKETNEQVVVDFSDMNRPYIVGEKIPEKRLLNVQPIYYRKMENVVVNGEFGEPRLSCYVVGFQGNLNNGDNFQQTVAVV